VIFFPTTPASLKTVEVDTTFYRTPNASTVSGWYEKTPPDFVFAAKVPQVITHERILVNCETEFEELISKILSNNAKIAATASATGTYFDGDELKNSGIVENTDIPHTLNRPWGVANKPLLSAIPTDTLVPLFTLQMATYREDRFKALIASFQSTEPAVGLAEHCIVAISPSSDKDAWLEQLDGSKLSYDSAANKLTYGGQLVTDHTFAVLWVGNAQAPDIQKLLLSSKAAWAALALSDFYNATLPEIAAKDDVPKIDKAFVQQLAACVDQLKREVRFSAYDRAVALRAFAERAKQMTASACAAKNIAAQDCKTPHIGSYKDGIDVAFGIKNSETKADIPKAVEKLSERLSRQFKIK
jgi:hypothetical protein